MKIDNELRHITDYLLLYSSYMSDIGLFHGKIGVAIALYMYAHKYNDELMSEYAWELFQQVYEKIHVSMPIGLEYGLAGIGYGTTLLQKYGLIDVDLNDTLFDIDAKIMLSDPRRATDMSRRSGVKGLWLYIMLRESIGEPITTFDTLYISELRSTIEKYLSNEPDGEILDLVFVPPFRKNEYTGKPLGIDGGSSYFLIKDFLG